ncbi:unnamed protein product [Protopolystoma xenopodis]|uniref:Peptidase M14 domain-containing protein n=1 Tax=Protopolystoma xenopodis TaxID=117903 RepID=A0A3S5B268_9PLAT|nr:unnamed protein product [Protopolystoma xenopodis]
MQDYNYLASNCFEITIELGCTKYPDAKELPSFWWQNMAALYNFIIQVHRGVKGMVYADAKEGLIPLPNATIVVYNLTLPNNVEPILHNVLTSE